MVHLSDGTVEFHSFHSNSVNLQLKIKRYILTSTASFTCYFKRINSVFKHMKKKCLVSATPDKKKIGVPPFSTCALKVCSSLLYIGNHQCKDALKNKKINEQKLQNCP